MFIFITAISDEKTKNKFEQLYFTYAKYLYSIGINIIKDKDLASDALQQCFLKVFQNIDKIDSVQSKQTKSFVSIIMRNESLIIYHKNKSLMSVTESIEDELYIKDEDADIDEIIARAELKKEVQAYLKMLTEDESNIIILKYLNEYSHEEISGILGVSQEVVRKRLSRARKKLATLIINCRKEA